MKIALLNKCKDLDPIFHEKAGSVSSAEQKIIFNPPKLLQRFGLTDVLDERPFKSLRTAGRIWEFYLLSFADPPLTRRRYKPLVKAINSFAQPVNAFCTRTKVGNPFDQWKQNYQVIEDRKLQQETRAFANMLLRRALPLRQSGTYSFSERRKAAAKAFLNYLVADCITHTLRLQLASAESFQEKLILLIHNYPDNRLFRTVCLITCLYGGKKVTEIDANLAKEVLKSTSSTSYDAVVNSVRNILKVKSMQKWFKPPYKMIYEPHGAGRDRVNIRFRIETWLKLVDDTANASK